MKIYILMLATCLCFSPHFVIADDSAEVAELQKQNELLTAKLEAAQLKIEKLEQQVKDLKTGEKKTAKEAVDDLFEEGSSWSGTRNYTQNGPNGGFQDWKLVILTRDGDKFTGEIHFTSNDNKAQALAVKGIAPPKDKGKVVFKTEQLGVFQQSFKGVLAGGQISLTFSGTGVEGTRVTGTGTLTQ